MKNKNNVLIQKQSLFYYLKFACKPTTGRLCLSAYLLALLFLFAIFSKFVLVFSVFPSAPFLRIEIGDFIGLVALFWVGPFYSILIIFFNALLRFFYLGDNPIGLLALFLADSVFILSFLFLFHFLNYSYHYWQKRKINDSVLLLTPVKSQNFPFAFIIGSVAMATIWTACLLSLFNYLFLIPLYQKYYGVKINNNFVDLILAAILPFNIIKFAINSLIFIIIAKPMLFLTKKSMFSYFDK